MYIFHTRMYIYIYIYIYIYFFTLLSFLCDSYVMCELPLVIGDYCVNWAEEGFPKHL
jgi:hypothetical protein